MPTVTVVETEVLPGFDYDRLNAEKSAIVRQKLSEIQTLIRTRTQNAIEIGLRLIEIKQAVGHGKWGQWLTAEFPGSQDTAERWMALAKSADQNPQIAEFAPSIAYELAGDEDSIEAASAVIETRGEINHRQVKGIKVAKKPTFEQGQEVYINAPESPLHGKPVTVSEIKGKQIIAQVEGKTVPLLPAEVSKTPLENVVPTQAQPTSVPQVSTEVNPVESLVSRLDVEAERVKYLEDLLRQICTAYYKSGEIPDDLLEEAQETIGMVP
jgi:Protein of unknown function (DUF3102)